MYGVVNHIPLKCAIQRKWTPSEVLCLRGKIAVFDKELDRFKVTLNFKVFYLYPDECVVIPEVGEELKDRIVTNVCNLDEESVFDRMPVVVVYMKDKRMLAEELKEFWRTL